MQPKAFQHIVTAGCLLLAILHADAYATIYKHTDTHQHSNTERESIEAIISTADSLNSLRQFQKAIDTLNHFTEHNPLDSLSLSYAPILKGYSDAFIGLNNSRKVVSILKQKLRILEQNPNQQQRQADAMLMILNAMTGDEPYESFIPMATRAIDLFRILDDNAGLAMSYLNAAQYFDDRRKDDLAIFFGKLANGCLMQEENPDIRDQMMIDYGIGAFLATKDIEESLYYYDRYYNASLLLEEDSIARGWSASRYGWALMHSQQYQDAIRMLRKGQSLLEPILGAESASLGHIYLTLGELYTHMDMLDSAQLYLDRTYTLYKNIDPNYRWLNAAYRMYAHLYKARKDYVRAIEYEIKSFYHREGIQQDSINIYDTLDVSNYQSNEVGRYTLLMNRHYFYSLYQQTGNICHLEQSLIYASQLTQFLLNIFYRDLSSEVNLTPYNHRHISNNLVAAFQHLNEYRDQEQFNTYKARLYNDLSAVKAYLLQSRVNLGQQIRGDMSESIFQKISDLQKEIDILESQTRLVESNINSTNEEYHRLAAKYLTHFMLTQKLEQIRESIDIEQTKVIGLDKLIATIPEETTLLDYFIADSALTIFSISKGGIEFTLTDIDSTFSQLLTNHNRALRTASPQFDRYNAKLSELLLEPVINSLEGKQEVIVIPHGELCNIPFETLTLPNGEQMLTEYAVSYHYSSNLLTFNDKPHISSYVAFAPGFVDEGNAMLQQTMAVRTDTSFLSSEIQYRNGSLLAPIPFAIDEVNEVSRLIMDRLPNQRIFIGDEASKSNFKASLADADIIHLATHGHTSISSPGLTGLFFAQNTGTDNGYLYLHELYTLTIDAHLVVLSACDTGRGMLLDSEGAFALPRGFITAGVPNVIASLWKVHDERTKELMVAFYRHMLDGNSYTQSLRLAKLDCISNGFLPLDWAGFVLIGG